MRLGRQLHRLAVLAALAAGCHDPYMPQFPLDMSTALPQMVWGHGAGMPIGQGRAGMPVVLSPTDRELVGFGGTPTTQTDTWAFSLRNDAWTTLILGTTPPPGRTGHCAVFLPTQNLVLFVGGHDDAGQPLTTPLTFLVGTPGYTDVTGTAPSVTAGCAAAYDATQARALVFGGTSGGAPSDETWLFDGTSALFAEAMPAHRPPARTGATLVVDPGPGAAAMPHLLLFGGAGGAGELADVWLWDGADWGELGTSADPDASDTDDPRPLGRADGAVALDPTRRALYVFGGARQGTLLDDLWRLDLRTLTWSRLHLDAGPEGRAQASAAYDPILDRFLVFGGRGAAGLLSDGWTLAPQ